MNQSSTKPKVIFVLGGPGSGKGTQCSLILKKYHYANFVHLSTGEVLRNASSKDTPENKEVIKLMKQGKMVPSKPLVQLLKNHIVQKGSGFTYIIDGFPRNKDNLQAWDQVIGNEFDIKFLLYFEVTEDEMRKRLLKRAETSGRADDNPETIEKRLKTFAAETKPMLSYYNKSGKQTVVVDSNTYIQRVEWQVCVELKKHGLI